MVIFIILLRIRGLNVFKSFFRGLFPDYQVTFYKPVLQKMFDIKYYTIPISNPLLVIIGKETSFYEKFGTY